MNAPAPNPERPAIVVVAGPTASGKSALAMRIADEQGGSIVNADAIQVFDNWRILTARPSRADEARHPHVLYGHIAYNAPYSVGHWLREVETLLKSDRRLIVVGGTGLNFTALTEGLADIPPTPPDIRAAANALKTAKGKDALLADLDPDTIARIDTQNPMRIQRAWEVQRQTGKGLAQWHAETPPPLLPLSDCCALVLDADTDWLNARIARRFDAMVAGGALDEARANLDRFDPDLLSCKAIGAPELVAHLRGETTLEQAKTAASIATRQFAKRQRTWFKRNKNIQWFNPLSDQKNIRAFVARYIK